MSEVKCLCCGKPLGSGDDLENCWHRRCCYHFFGTTIFPKISLSKETISELASTTVSQGFTVAGVQKKMSLHLSKEKESRLSLVGYPAGYILKPQTEDFDFLPEMEHLVMNMASLCGIKTVPHALVKMEDGLAYITRRIDRISREGKTLLLAMEDFCQLSQRLTEDKYRSSYERCGKIIKDYSAKSGLDLVELFYRLLFCFVTGNSDMHLKNFSLIEEKSASRLFSLSPAYDLLPVNLAMPEDKEEFALTMGGKKSNIKYQDFMNFARSLGLNEKIAGKMVKRLLSFKEKCINLTKESFLPEDYQKKMIALVEERMARLENTEE